MLPTRRKLAADGIYTFGLRVLAMIVAAALGVLTARILGTHGRGIYAAPMVDAGIASAAFTGLASAVSFYLLRKDSGRSIVRAAILAAACFVACAAIITALLAWIAHAPWATFAAVLSLPGPAILMLASGYATGTHRIRITSSLTVASSVFFLALMVIVFLFISRTPYAAIAVWVTTTDLAGIAMLVWMIVDSRRLAPGTTNVREFLLYALRSGAVSLVSLLNYRADIYIVAVLGTPAMLGMYTLAVSASETLLAVTQVTAVVTAPHIGSLDDRAAAELAARSVRHNVLISSICCALLAVVAPFAVRWLYGAAFTAVVPALRILLIGVFALSLGSPMSTYFTIRLGRPEVALVLASVSAAICIAGSLLLVPRVGLVGAAVSSTGAYIVGQTAAILYFRSVSGIGTRTMLIPRFTDVRAYAQALASMMGT